MLEKKGTGLAFLSGPAPMLAGVLGIFGAVYLTVKYMANKKGYHRTSPRTLSVNPNDSVELPLIKVENLSFKNILIFRSGDRNLSRYKDFPLWIERRSSFRTARWPAHQPKGQN